MAVFGQISAKEHYVLRMMLCIAPSFYDAKAVSLAKVSEDEQISQKYLEQIIRPFMDAGWVKSTRGQHGGYILLKDPKKISLKNILAISEGKLTAVECLSEKGFVCPVESKCLSKSAWHRVQRAMESALDEIILGELLT